MPAATAKHEVNTAALRLLCVLALLRDMPAQSHHSHDEEQHDQKKQNPGDGVIAHSPSTFKPLAFQLCSRLVIAVHPTANDGRGGKPATCSTRSAANSANKYRMETPNRRRACGSPSVLVSRATRIA